MPNVMLISRARRTSPLFFRLFSFAFAAIFTASGYVGANYKNNAHNNNAGKNAK